MRKSELTIMHYHIYLTIGSTSPIPTPDSLPAVGTKARTEMIPDDLTSGFAETE